MDNNIRKYFHDDKNYEEAMLKTCLLFSSRNIRGKRQNLFYKKVLAIFLSGRASNANELFEYLKKEGLKGIDTNIVENSLKYLKQYKLIDVDNKGNVTVQSKKKAEADNDVNKVSKQLDDLCIEIISHIKKNMARSYFQLNQEQLKLNVENCLNYYFEVSSYSILGIDNPKNINNLTELRKIAGNNLNNKDKFLIDQIILSIGEVIENPDEKQRNALEVMAQTSVSARLAGIDPLLSNFKERTISDKTFILDTDVVLHTIVDNSAYSGQFRYMLQRLSEIGSKIIVPNLVVEEVFNHGSAAINQYKFAPSAIENLSDPMMAGEEGNIFVMDYCLGKIKGVKTTWDNYIRNFYIPEEGIDYTRDCIEEKFSELQINADFKDDIENTDIDLSDKGRLTEKTFQATKNTPKGLRRSEKENYAVAETDSLLYLTTKKKNENSEKDRRTSSNNDKILHYLFYVLTNSSRVHRCAKELNISAEVLCKPSALIAYLEETGYLNKQEPSFLNLFHNPFLSYISHELWGDTKKMLNVGIDIRGRNLLSLRKDVEKEVHLILSKDISVEEKVSAYEDIMSKGIELQPGIKNILDNKDNSISELKKQVQKLNDEALEREKQIKAMEEKYNMLEDRLHKEEQKKNKEKYQKRVHQFKKKAD